MPEQQVPPNNWEVLREFLEALGKLCSYRIDNPDSKWVPVYLVGINPVRNCIEVLPQRGTPYGDTWYEDNKPTFNFFPEIIEDPQPSPIEVTDFTRIRIS